MLARLDYNRRERADLHLHSNHSDGLHAPAELARLAAEQGLAVVALTDHATVAGVPAMSIAGARAGLHVVPGVELNARDADLLGYWVDDFHPPSSPSWQSSAPSGRSEWPPSWRGWPCRT